MLSVEKCIDYTCLTLSPNQMSNGVFQDLLEALGCDEKETELAIVESIFSYEVDSALFGSLVAQKINRTLSISSILVGSTAVSISKESFSGFLNSNEQLVVSVMLESFSDSFGSNEFFLDLDSRHFSDLEEIKFIGEAVQINVFAKNSSKLEAWDLEKPIKITQNFSQKHQVSLKKENEVLDAVYFDEELNQWTDFGVFLEEIQIEGRLNSPKSATIASNHLSTFGFVFYRSKASAKVIPKTSGEMIKNPSVLMNQGAFSSLVFGVIAAFSFSLFLAFYLSCFFDGNSMEILQWCFLDQAAIPSSQKLLRLVLGVIKSLLVLFLCFLCNSSFELDELGRLHKSSFRSS